MIKSFEHVISSKLKDEKLHYLVQYTSGKPRDLIVTCLHMETNKAYKMARLLLERWYGNSAVIATAYVNKFLKWEQVKRDDVEGLDEFVIMLGSCENAVFQVPYEVAELHRLSQEEKIKDLSLCFCCLGKGYIATYCKNRAVKRVVINITTS